MNGEDVRKIHFIAGLIDQCRGPVDWYGFPFLAFAAQAVVETGWGLHIPANNLAGIKATGDTWEFAHDIGGWEVRDGVRRDEAIRLVRYQSWTHCALHWGRLMRFSRLPYIMTAREAADTTPVDVEIVLLRIASGWATDPDYAAKLLSVLPHISSILKA